MPPHGYQHQTSTIAGMLSTFWALGICLYQHTWSITKNQDIVVIVTDRHSKVSRAILTAKITSTQLAHILVNDWVIPYEITQNIISDRRQQF